MKIGDQVYTLRQKDLRQRGQTAQGFKNLTQAEKKGKGPRDRGEKLGNKSARRRGPTNLTRKRGLKKIILKNQDEAKRKENIPQKGGLGGWGFVHGSGSHQSGSYYKGGSCEGEVDIKWWEKGGEWSAIAEYDSGMNFWVEGGRKHDNF